MDGGVAASGRECRLEIGAVVVHDDVAMQHTVGFGSSYETGRRIGQGSCTRMTAAGKKP